MTASTQHELTLVREFDAPREKIYKAWTDPDLLKQWFVPRPWGVAEATLDVRPGGSNVVVMQDPEGNQYPNRGVYLEIVENEKIVFTDAYTSAWVPADKPFFTGVILLEDLGNGRTKYTAKALHWRAEDKEEHEKMGFHEGWGKAADQLAELLAKM
jgi:uncharacterized protein YndB with AHSA1/START domain